MSAAGHAVPARSTRRGVVVLGIVVLALVAFGSTTQTWVSVRLPQVSVQTPDLAIAGSDAATPVTAFALVALAAALAVSIAGRLARWIVAVILVLSGLGIALSSAAVALDPATAAEPAVGTAIGVSGLAGAEATSSPMPWVAVVAGVLLVLAAAWVVLAGRTWGSNKRFDAGASRTVRPAADSGRPGALPPSKGDVAPGVVPEAGTGADDGDSTGTPGSTGDRPVRDARQAFDSPDSPDGAGTGPQDGEGDASPKETQQTQETPDLQETPGSGERTRTPARRKNAHADEIDSWDALSRGNDPTR